MPTPPPGSGRMTLNVGLAAGAEDVKYQAKYKELKRKVKEIESDNDKLHFKVLQAKRSIQRMKLERAILYERLQQVPPSPEMQDRHALPPVPPPQPHREYMQRSHSGGSTRIPAAASAGPPPPYLPPRAAPGPHVSPHAHSAPPPHFDRSPSTRSRSSYHNNAYEPGPPLAPPLHSPPLDRAHSHSHSSHSHSHSHSHSRSSRHEIHNSLPPLSPPGETRRTTTNSSSVHNHQRIGPGTYVNRDGPDWDSGGGSSARYRDRERERERDTYDSVPPGTTRADAPPHIPAYYSRPVWSRSSSPPSASGSGDERDYFPASLAVDRRDRDRERDSRDRDRERERGGGGQSSFRLRPVLGGGNNNNNNHTNDEVDFVHEDGRQPPQMRDIRDDRDLRDRERERNGGGGGYADPIPGGGRKRGRNDMDVDDDEGGGGADVYSSSRDERESRGKRYHPSASGDRI